MRRLWPLLFVACQPPEPAAAPERCGVTCVDGHLVTAGHCLVPPTDDPVNELPLSCQWRCTRAARQDEAVDVNGRGGLVVVDPNWGHYLILDGPFRPGESGGPVSARSDGCLLGVALENHDRMGYAWALADLQDGGQNTP